MPLFWLGLAFCAALMLAAQSAVRLLPAALAWFGLALGLLLLRGPWQRWPLWCAGPVRRLASRLPRRRLAGLLRVWLWLQTRLVRAGLPALWLLAAACGLGVLRWALWQPDPAALTLPRLAAAQQRVIVEGWLARPPDERDTFTLLWLRAEQLRLPEELRFASLDEWLLVRAGPGGDWHYGDRLRLSGELMLPPEEELFSYRAYLARQQVYSLLDASQVLRIGDGRGQAWRAWLYAQRERAEALIYQTYPDPEASLLAGILLGQENGIERSVQRAFQQTGAAHIIAISGFNMTLLISFLIPLFNRLRGRWWGAGLVLLVVGLYTILTGADPAALRAALVGGLALLGRQLGRRQQTLNSLGLAAVWMAALDPAVLWDAGFQLSFAAFFGLSWLAQPLEAAFEHWARRFSPIAPTPALPATSSPLNGEGGGEMQVEQAAAPRPLWARLMWEYVLLTLVVQLATLPVMLFHFRRISLAALWVNPLILPVQPPLMTLAGLGLVVGLFWQPLGQALAAPAWALALYTIRVVEWAAALPGSSWAAGLLPAGVVLLFYAALLAAPGLLHSAGRRLRPAALLTLLLALSLLAWQQAGRAPDGRLHLIVLDVNRPSESGEGLLIQTPSGRYVLINGGPSPSALSTELGRRLPYFGRRLDVLLVAGVEDGQLQALPPVLERFPPGQVLWAGGTQAGRAARSLYLTVNELGLPLTTAQTGQTLDLGNGARLEVLHAGPRGAVLWLEWGRFRALLPVGPDVQSLEALAHDPARQAPTALLLAGSGYTPLNPPQWVQQLQPQMILLSVAAADWRGLPDPALLQALDGFNLLRTDRQGWIDLSTDGEQVWVTVERP